ncbi:MAG: FMN-binding protein [Angustibacter sp.]
MRRIVFAVVGTVTSLVLLFSYSTSTNQAGVAAESAVRPAETSAPTASEEPMASDEAAEQTFEGEVVQTRWGPVQVQITVRGSEIIAADAVVTPTEHLKSVEIADDAVPVLNQEAVEVQSADIETVTGATVTTEGYTESLQSAIDAAAAAGVTVGA